MFARTASGGLLPCDVVYKAEHFYNTWTENRPRGTRYNRSKSDWFDGVMNCFRNVALKYFQRFDKKKPKMLIGDNLASHVSINVINISKVKQHTICANSFKQHAPLPVSRCSSVPPTKIILTASFINLERNTQRMHTKGLPSLLNQILEILNENIDKTLTPRYYRKFILYCRYSESHRLLIKNTRKKIKNKYDKKVLLMLFCIGT